MKIGTTRVTRPWARGAVALAAAAASVAAGCSTPGSGASAPTVAGRSAARTSAPVAAGTPGATAAARYRRYVQAEADALLQATQVFVVAVKAGDVASARRLYPAARFHYETIEPVSRFFVDLDPRIDGRANDTPSYRFAGFHRIERQLFGSGNTVGMAPFADELLASVKTFRLLAPTVKPAPSEIADDAVELLGASTSSAVTGEEDPYSGTDLWDISANESGAAAAFAALRPLVATRDAPLAAKIDAQFAMATATLHRYATPSGGFARYSSLTPADTRRIARSIDVLADSLAATASVVGSS